MIGDIFTYPFRGTGKYFLIIGAVLSLLLSLGMAIPFLGLIIAIGASGYFSAYMFEIINSTACGYKEACDWPDFHDFFSDLIVPWLCMLSAFFFSFGPYMILSMFFEDAKILSYVLLILGVIHMPMAMLCVALSRSMRSAFWANTIPKILDCLPRYFILVLLFGGLLLLRSLLAKALVAIPPVLGWFLSYFLGMYILMVTGRMLGLFYRDNSKSIA